ncbi:MAG: Dehydrogenases with different specificities (related to short-chain alcohol dehydrogenases) [uncultured Solirubrobacteraceae bacterium]|uniref:Dehydrogenases with different specificities (Related to short-chain alcohol dehydrogenases) n=1 Tax=uncultured Solirubrobacteraceae bacterium TaxID=1162706 RepID=A0A6J4RV93_9ACTN|nr:MAG: Dehydrogenases with different specificities (related to short-chain alcohol dehydrogenases) [uncultured Solirubrobacteraceae bacterium]
MTEQPPAQQQDLPGDEDALTPQADHGDGSYQGSGRLEGKATVITGADSGIGRAVAIAFAREGADVVISYLEEHDDAKETARLVEESGRRAILVPGDIADAAHCRAIIAKAVEELGRVDVLVNNAAFQMARGRDKIEDIPDDEWDHTFATNITAMFHTVKAAVPHMKPGSSIINTTSIQADQPSPNLLPYAATKAAILNFTGNLAQMLGERGIRANCVAPGPIWTPLIPSTMPEDQVEGFGTQTPLGRPGQPAELAAAYVMLASDEASYISGANIAVTGGKPII